MQTQRPAVICSTGVLMLRTSKLKTQFIHYAVVDLGVCKREAESPLPCPSLLSTLYYIAMPLFWASFINKVVDLALSCNVTRAVVVGVTAPPQLEPNC